MPNQPGGSLPSQMIDAYARIQVSLDPPFSPVTVRVQKYACQHPGYGQGQAERMAYKDRLLGAIGGVRGIAPAGLTTSGFVGVFSGKGTMDEIAGCLALAARHGIYSHLNQPAGFAQAGQSTAQLLQGVADAYIGLDCNGFVGNWAIYNVVPGASASYLPLDWLSGRRLRNSLAEIRPYDVVVWANGNHIAIIESVGFVPENGNTLLVLLAESSTGGMLTHPATRITFRTTPTAAARGPWQTHFSLQNDIHGDTPVLIASMARGQ